MKPLLSILVLLFLQELPFKPKDEFSVKLDYDFKNKPVTDNSHIYHAEEEHPNTTPLPFLTVLVQVDKVTAETKVRINSNKKTAGFVKKVAVGSTYQVPFGFTDDVKDGVSANEYTLTFLDKEKNAMSRIVLYIDKEGQFFVNGEKQGKF
jgi:hypothetical protein